MKRVVFSTVIAVVSFFSACSPKLTKRETYPYVFDFREYTQSGFFLSPSPYVGTFDPVGEIIIYVLPAKVKNTEIHDYEIGTLFGKPKAGSEFKTTIISEKISKDELLTILVEEAKSLGADGIVNLSISDGTRIIEGKSYYILSGFAIKRI